MAVSQVRQFLGDECMSTIEGDPCPRKPKTLGYCVLHYGRMRTGGKMDAPVVERREEQPESCGSTILGEPCGGDPYANGFCTMHYHRDRTAPTPRKSAKFNRVMGQGGSATVAAAAKRAP
jgi:hypothetical protein